MISKYGDAGATIPEYISGHSGDGAPTKQTHVAIVPLADLGWKHSEGRLMGLALILPRVLEDERRRMRESWLAGVAESGPAAQSWAIFDHGVNEITRLRLGSLGGWEIRRTLESGKKSLDPRRYCRKAQVWASATAVVLDRFPKGKAGDVEEEVEAIIAESCANIGLPKPMRVRAGKHAAIQGAPSSYPSGKAPPWTGWALPRALAHRLLTHVVIEFSEPVEGPVIIGAGRYYGLGLCLPMSGCP
jgi:CRISPR-associated protein Csb2